MNFPNNFSIICEFISHLVSSVKSDHDPEQSKMILMKHLSEPETFNNSNCKCGVSHPNHPSYHFYGSYYSNGCNYNFQQSINSLTLSNALNCNCNNYYSKQCLHIHYKTRKNLFIHLLSTINYANYQKFNLTSNQNDKYLKEFQKNINYFAEASIHTEHPFCGNCINYLFEYDDLGQKYIDVFIDMLKVLKNITYCNYNHPRMYRDEPSFEGYMIASGIFMRFFLFPTFRNIVLSDFDLFKICCKSWHTIAMSMCDRDHLMDVINDDSNDNDTITNMTHRKLPIQYLIAFYLSVYFWNKKHMVYFVRFFYNVLLDQILKPVEDLFLAHYKSTHVCFYLRPIANLQDLIHERYCKLFTDKQSVIQWMFNEMSMSNCEFSKQLTITAEMIISFEKCHQDFSKDVISWSVEHKTNMDYYRKAMSSFAKATIVMCYQCAGLMYGSGRIQKLKLCSQCIMVYYCSRRCQKLHWNAHHRYKCKQLKRVRIKYIKHKINDSMFSDDLIKSYSHNC